MGGLFTRLPKVQRPVSVIIKYTQVATFITVARAPPVRAKPIKGATWGKPRGGRQGSNHCCDSYLCSHCTELGETSGAPQE